MLDGTVSIDWISFGEVLTHIEDISKLETLRAFPNPASDQVFLEYDLVQTANVTINIFDHLGKLVVSKNRE